MWRASSRTWIFIGCRKWGWTVSSAAPSSAATGRDLLGEVCPRQLDGPMGRNPRAEGQREERARVGVRRDTGLVDQAEHRWVPGLLLPTSARAYRQWSSTITWFSKYRPHQVSIARPRRNRPELRPIPPRACRARCAARGELIPDASCRHSDWRCSMTQPLVGGQRPVPVDVEFGVVSAINGRAQRVVGRSSAVSLSALNSEAPSSNATRSWRIGLIVVIVIPPPVTGTRGSQFGSRVIVGVSHPDHPREPHCRAPLPGHTLPRRRMSPRCRVNNTALPHGRG